MLYNEENLHAICAIMSRELNWRVLVTGQTLKEALIGEGVCLSFNSHRRIADQLTKAGYIETIDVGSSRFLKPGETTGVMWAYDESEELFMWVAFSK